MKIVINSEYGGFVIPRAWREELGLDPEKYIYKHDRTDPRLVELVEMFPSMTDCVVVEIPDGAHYLINEYDGLESVFWSESVIHTVYGEKD